MIINSKWWEETENIATMVKYMANQAMANDNPMAWHAALGQIAEAVDDPPEHRETFVAALLDDPEALICRCGECGGKEWTVGSKLQDHFVGLLDRGRSLNFVEPQEDEEAS